MHRKLLPLALLGACEGDEIEGRTRLQKLVFLMEQELEEESKSSLDSPDYGFIAYDYGPFSKELYDDLDSLEDADLIDVEEEDITDGKVKYTYRLTEEGRSWARHLIDNEGATGVYSLAEDLKEEYNDMLLSDLINKVYAEYPEYAKNSVW
ncbi:helix-turn-helix transcriptional regulator [Halorarum halophilum]|uniref:Helix-turn-helix transcriptional regulator n=1 Tax=Halorarum halophilum TaxID=2743090 RepID=A0A7D5K1T0_9EURY|nr:type II toxin-antitoxin system antitoxin SocA domain-containing protein [Halobaculum halophilum]QLG28181.1 helix-turn-helix transcriptional regulator [Halobaculum halophilum]